MRDPFLNQITIFFKTQKVLSVVLILNLLGFIIIKEKFFVLFFYLFLLYFSGTILVKKLSDLYLLLSFLLGGLLGATAHLSWLNFQDFKIDELANTVIQSAILTVLCTITTFVPNYQIRIFITLIRLQYLSIVFIIIIALSIKNPPLFIAIITSMFFGLVFGFIIKTNKNNEWQKIMRFFKIYYPKKPRMKATHTGKRAMNDYEYNNNRAEKQKRIDSILDKISKSGYESLSKEEKDFLFNSSKH